MALCALGHLGAPLIADRVETEGPVAVWKALNSDDAQPTAWARRAAAIVPERIAEATQRCGARFLIPDDPEWPDGIDLLTFAEVNGQKGRPFGLWVRGVPLPAMDEAVAIVGSRSATPYGQHVAVEMAADLAAEGRTIVSGLAFGIDAAAHRGALSVGGITVAAVAGGVDRPYPAANASLASFIVRTGAVVSELPPGHKPSRPGFLARNRLIAGMAGGLVVIEAALRSGAKNSAAWANELGRVVMAVPGAVTSAYSQTPHRLIRDGAAVLVTDARDVRELLSPLGEVEEPSRRGEDTALDLLPDHLREIREAIDADEEVGAATLAARIGVSTIACLAGLGELSERGWVEAGADGWRLPRRRIPEAS
ncbi:MAG: DNA-protecting protein DprA [Propionibacterium sp.]|nr:DNA-protecting protein DprA [Propionibacterium sp.]